MRRKGFQKEEVYDGMLKLAGKMWNLKDSQLSTLDPVVKLLMKGVASEVERIGDELQSSETRILKRIASQLMPSEMVGVLPAHGVIHFTPIERSEISRYDHFEFEMKWINKAKFSREEIRQINFTPSGSFKLSAGSIDYRVETGRVSEVEGLNKDLTDFDSHIEDDHLIVLGFDKINDESLTLYFDWLSVSTKQELFTALSKLTVTTLSGKPIPLRHGLKPLAEAADEFEKRLDTTVRIEHSINAFYANRFIELSLKDFSKDDFKLKDNSVPFNFLDTINDLPGGSEKFWICLRFPQEFTVKEVQDVFIQVNCFPTINRMMKREIFRLQPGLNIRSLPFEGSFMTVERVVTTDDQDYVEETSIRLGEYSAGTYSVRKGGIGRLDERDAEEFITYLMNLITEERQAFASMDVSATTEDLKVIEQAVKRVQKRIQSKGEKGLSPYLLLKPFNQYENVYTYYWTCSGELANGVSIGSKLESKTSGLSKSGSALLLTNTTGGRDELSDINLIETYRNAVLSRKTVVTKEDIISLCKVIGGKHIADVKVTNEIQPSPVLKQGLVKVLAVNLVLKASGQEPIVQNYILRKVESELDTRSNFSMPFKILSSND